MLRGNLANAAALAGNPERMIPMLKQTLARLESKRGVDHVETIGLLNQLALRTRDAHQLESAEPLFRELWERRSRTLGPGEKSTIDAEQQWGVCLSMMGRREEAERHFLHCLSESRKATGVPANWVQVYQEHLAELYDDWGKPRKAAEFLRTERQASLDDEISFANALFEIGLSRLRKLKWSEAESVLRECVEIQRARRPDDWRRYNAMRYLGNALLGEKEYVKAEPILLDAYNGMKAQEAHIPLALKVRISEAAAEIAKLYEATGQPEQARRWLAHVWGNTAVCAAQAPIFQGPANAVAQKA